MHRALQLLDSLNATRRYRSVLTVNVDACSSNNDFATFCNENGKPCNIVRFEEGELDSNPMHGSFGTVYRIRRTNHVLKVLNTGLSNDVRREILVAKTLGDTQSLNTSEQRCSDNTHDNIVAVCECLRVYLPNEPDQRIALVFQDAGTDLFEFMDARIRQNASNPEPKSALTPSELYIFMKDLLQGTLFLHSRGVYHLDIKLENLLIAESTQSDRPRILRICDFGLSHCNDWEDGIGSLASSERHDRNRLYFGSLAYLPHLRLATHPEFVSKRDQWAIGCTLFAMAYDTMLYESPYANNGSGKPSVEYYRVLTKSIKKTPEYFVQVVDPELTIKKPNILVEDLLDQLLVPNPKPLLQIVQVLQQTSVIAFDELLTT